MNLSDWRREYTIGGLHRKDLLEDPFQQFDRWLRQAHESGIDDVNAMSLATSSSRGEPTIRTVLLKYVDESGFVFFTNYESAKARQIGENPRVALLFPWLPLERQVIVNGQAEKISALRSAKYFLTRPRGAQLGAWVSQQSSALSSRSLLEMKFEEIKGRFAKGEVPLPSFWGGFLVRPHRFEFWQGRTNRLHDRFEYRLQDNRWNVQRLSP